MSTPVYLDGAVLFETKRLTCRRWLASDVEEVYRLYSNPEVVRWIGDGSPITREESRAWLDVTSRNYVNRGYGMFALLDRVTGDTAGFVGLVHPNDQVDVEIKYALPQSRWGRGLASEIVQATISYGACVHTLAKITATVAPENGASQRVLTKAGFVLVRERTDDHAAAELYYEWHTTRESLR